MQEIEKRSEEKSLKSQNRRIDPMIRTACSEEEKMHWREISFSIDEWDERPWKIPTKTDH